MADQKPRPPMVMVPRPISDTDRPMRPSDLVTTARAITILVILDFAANALKLMAEP